MQTQTLSLEKIEEMLDVLDDALDNNALTKEQRVATHYMRDQFLKIIKDGRGYSVFIIG
jgi:hypothetical protein